MLLRRHPPKNNLVFRQKKSDFRTREQHVGFGVQGRRQRDLTSAKDFAGNNNWMGNVKDASKKSEKNRARCDDRAIHRRVTIAGSTETPWPKRRSIRSRPSPLWPSPVRLCWLATRRKRENLDNCYCARHSSAAAAALSSTTNLDYFSRSEMWEEPQKTLKQCNDLSSDETKVRTASPQGFRLAFCRFHWILCTRISFPANGLELLSRTLLAATDI